MQTESVKPTCDVVTVLVCMYQILAVICDVLQICRSARLVVYEYCNSIVKCVLLCQISAIRIWQLQVRSTAHNINTAGRQTWSTAWQGISRPSSLLTFFKKDQQEDTWTDGNAEGGESGQRQPLVRYNNEYEQNGTEPK